MRIALVLVGSLAVFTGCGLVGEHCVQGQSAACTCTDGKSGAQLCNAQGGYDACLCSGSTGTGGGSGTGGGTGGGTSSGPKRVFVSNLRYATTAAGSVCQGIADSVNLGGQWVAWLSTTSTTALSRVPGNGPWNLITGATAFANRGQLSTAPSVPINVTESGATLQYTSSGSTSVWTGTLTGGTAASRTCADWTSTSYGSYGEVGDLTSTSAWTDSSYDSCSGAFHVYCFEL